MATIPVATAMAYLAAGLSCLPAAKARKHPAIGSWKNWQTRLPTEVEVRAWFSNAHDAICVVSGAVSGNLECMDFDNGGELFAAWMEKVDTGLLAKLVIEQTPSGGYHVCYRCESPVEGNLKLARGNRDGKLKTLIETRGEGGLFLCAPTEGYALQQGDFASVPTITPDARQALLEAARSLDELPAASTPTAPAGANVGQRGADFAPTGGKDAFDLAPGDDFNARGDVHPLLLAAGWQFAGNNPDGNELWTRPGKDPRNGISATYKDGSFYVFSSNAAPFEPNVMYSPFAVYATLNHNGDYTAAASALLTQGYGKAKSDLGGVTLNLKPTAAGTTQAEEGPIPLGTLKKRFPEMRPVLIDGFLRIGETMNIIAAPKTGKSWLVTQLCVCVASGTDWFGHVCTPGRVLIIDNELHEETSANRIPLVVDAMRRANPSLPNVDDMIDVWNLRGKWKSIADLSVWLPRFREAGYRMIVIDAFYRALPKDTDENDNGSIAKPCCGHAPHTPRTQGRRLPCPGGGRAFVPEAGANRPPEGVSAHAARLREEPGRPRGQVGSRRQEGRPSASRDSETPRRACRPRPSTGQGSLHRHGEDDLRPHGEDGEAGGGTRHNGRTHSLRETPEPAQGDAGYEVHNASRRG